MRDESLREMLLQYITIDETLEEIDKGAAYVSIYTKCDHIDMSDLFPENNYLQRIRGDLLYYRQDLRRQLIEHLTAEDRLEPGLKDSDSDWVDGSEPYPIGTPKNDHRRSGGDSEN